MKCKKCKGRAVVTASKRDKDGLSTRRRRKCNACGYRFSTIESETSTDYKIEYFNLRDRLQELLYGKGALYDANI